MGLLRRMMWVCLLSLGVLGCGPEEEERPVNNIKVDDNNTATNGSTNNGTNGTNNGTTGTNNTNGTANNVANTNSFGAGCEGVQCETGRRCVKGECVLDELKVSCEDFQDLGEVDLTQTVTASGNTDGFADAIETTCSVMDEFSGAENAIKFTVPSLAEVSISLDSSAAVDWVIEVRADDCGSSDAQIVCSDIERFDFVAEPGTEYFVLVEPRVGIDKGTFDIEMSFQELVCSPPGGKSCDADSVVVCQAGTSEATFACGTSCSDGACGGDTCDNVFEVTGSMSFSGDTQAYTNSLNFESQPACSGSGQQGLITPGPEVILSLPGLTAGQTVTVDASMNDDNDNAILILDTCTDTAPCLAGNDLGDLLSWTVEADGDYFVVIDKLSTSAKPFNYAIDIE